MGFTGRIKKYVQAAELLYALGGGGLQFFRKLLIRMNIDGVIPKLFDKLMAQFIVYIGKNKLASCFIESFGRGRADAGNAPVTQATLPFKSMVYSSLWFWILKNRQLSQRRRAGPPCWP